MMLQNRISLPAAKARLLFMMLMVLGLAALVAGGCARPDQEEGQAATTGQDGPAETARNVRVLELQRDSLEEFIEIAGPMAPVRGADISAQETGTVVALPAAKGQAVEAGQALVEQDRAILKAEKDAAASNLATQAYNLDKTRKLFEAGKVSKFELLEIQAAHDAARAQAQVSADRYRRALISSPFAGVLTDRFVELGELVMPGQPVARVIDPYTLKLESHLTADQVAYAQVGSPAVIRLGDGDTQAQGTISWVGLEADVMTGKFKVEVEVPNPDLRLRSGVIGRARISKNISRDVVSVPREALMEGRHGLEVFVIEDGRAYRRGISTGPDQGPLVVVTEGLKAGDQLVVRGHRELVEGCLVKITQKATAPDGTTANDPAVVRNASQVETGDAR